MSVIGSNILAGASGNQGGGYSLTRSLRFRNSATAYLNRTPSSNGNRKTWTYSVWLKRGAFAGVYYGLLGAQLPATSNFQYLRFGSDGTGSGAGSDNIEFGTYNNTTDFACFTRASFRDPSAWYHIVVQADTTQATSSNRIKIYVNGVQQTLVGTYPTLNQDLYFNSTSYANGLGDIAANGSQTFDGYMTEINFIDGQALTPSSFGETDTDTGVWKLKQYSGSYGTNGFYLPFSDPSSTTNLVKDSSGNGNNWTPNNISLTAGATYDSMTDYPALISATAANYCTINPVIPNLQTITDGNLKVAFATGAGSALGSIEMASGKWYWEITSLTSATGQGAVGIFNSLANTTSWLGAGTNSWGYWNAGEKYTNASGTAYGATWGAGDVIGIAVDADAGSITFYKNGTSQGVAYSGLTAPFYAAHCAFSSGESMAVNFGQQGFKYTPPTGFKALNTFNLPTPSIGATASTQAGKYFNAVTYTGNGSSRTISGVGFQPDLVWVKVRNTTGTHVITDAVRGGNKQIYSNLTNSEGSATNKITGFASDGFTLGADNGTGTGDANFNGNTYVAWCWDGNGSGSSNTAGSTTSTVSANTTSGFSVVTFTAPSSGQFTVGHGLGVKPSMVIIKSRTDSAYSWYVWHQSMSSATTSYLRLNSSDGTADYSTMWGSAGATSTTLGFTVAGSASPSGTHVAYAFSEVAGYSKIGSYTGNGSADGTFVYTGFRPRFVLLKRTNAVANWILYDTARATYNLVNNILLPDSNSAELTSADYNVDLVSNGFKFRTAQGGINGSSDNIIYMAFAENPFKYSLAR